MDTLSFEMRFFIRAFDKRGVITYKESMPNQPDPNKVLVGVRTPRELAAVLTQEAQEHGLKLPGLIVRILQQYVGDPSKRLSRFEMEDIEQEKRAARQEAGSRRSAKRLAADERRLRYEPELVTGGTAAPVSETVWRATMNSIAVGWQVQEEEDGFCLCCERVPGHVGVHFQEGRYEIFANYWGPGCSADFSKPLKWRYGGSRSYGCWHTALHSPALGMNLRSICAGELAAYIRSGKDDALRKLADKMRELIACMRAYHRRAAWCTAAQEAMQAAGWYGYTENWRFLRCCRHERDQQVGEVQLLAYEPIENENIRLELQLASGSSGHLRTLLRAMGRRDLAGRVRGGSVILEEAEMALAPTGAADEALSAERLVLRLAKWMGRINTCLKQELPLENFAALAVETANHDFASICDLGVVIVRRGKLSQKLHLPVQPKGNLYEEQFTKWHGISAVDTEKAPLFAEAWEQLAPLLHGLPMVVYSPGIAARLHAALSQAELPMPEFSLLQNLSLARKRFPELSSHNLYDVASHMGFPITELGALPKAEACAHIALELFRAHEQAPAD